MELIVSEIFSSIQGESSWAGYPTVFIRLAGCNLKCAWCDTKYAWDEGAKMTIDEVMEKVMELSNPHKDITSKYTEYNGVKTSHSKLHGINHVCITGGEPLIQPDEVAELVKKLAEEQYKISIETNGAEPVKWFKDLYKGEIYGWEYIPVKIVMDVKPPSAFGVRELTFSDYTAKVEDNLRELHVDDELKFVVWNENDMKFVEWFLEHYPYLRPINMFVSPCILPGDAKDGDYSLSQKVAKWLLEKKLPLRMQIQMHKVIWPEKNRGV